MRIALLVSVAVGTLTREAWPQNQEPADASAPAKSNSYSIRLIEDRRASAHVASVRGHLKSQVPARAIADVQLLLAVSGDSGGIVVPESELLNWPEGTEVLVGRHEAVSRLIRQASGDALRLFETQFQSEADQRLQSAINDDDFDLVRKTARQFELTTAGLRAFRYLAARALDRGQRREAAAALRQVLNHPLLPAGQRQTLAARFARLTSPDADNRPSTATTTSGTDKVRARDPATRPPIDILPLLTSPIWEGKESGEAVTLVADATHELGQQSIPVIPRAQPQRFGSQVLFRANEQLVGFDLESGEKAWSNRSTEMNSLRAGMALNLSLQDLAARGMAHEAQVNSVLARMTWDGERVYLVELQVPQEGRRLRSRQTFPRAALNAARVSNRIVAVEPATGRVDRVSGDLGFPIEEQPVYFLGPPTALDGRLYGLVQSGDALRVYAMDSSNGRILWTQRIGQSGRDGATDSDWRSIACPVIEADGMLICPTAAGAIVGIDLVTRDVRWAVRYPRTDAAPSLAEVGRATGQSSRPWWKSWRDVSVFRVVVPLEESGSPKQSRSIVLVTSPDRQDVVAIDPVTGRMRWRYAVASPLFVADASPSRFVIAERHRFVALNPVTGRVLWQTPALEPSGSGYVASSAAGDDRSTQADYYVYPTRSRRLVAIRLADGTMRVSPLRSGRIVGNLAIAGGFVFEQSTGKKAAWPTVARRISVLKKSAESGSIDTTLSLTNAMTVASQFEPAAERLRETLERLDDAGGDGADVRAVRSELIRTLTAWGEADPAQWVNLHREIRGLFLDDSIQQEIAYRHAVARSTTGRDAPDRVLDRYLQLADLNPEGDILAEDTGAARMVRYDRLLQGELLDLVDALTDSQRDALKAAFTERLQRTIESPDPFAVQRLASRFSGVPWTGHLQLRDEAQVGQRYLTRQLSLLRLTDHPEAGVQSAALARLAALYEEQSYSLDRAAALLRRHRMTTAKSDTEPDADVEKAASDLQQVLRSSGWTRQPSSVSERSQITGSAQCLNVPVSCDRGSLFNRLHVSITARASRSGRVVRFAGDGRSGAWQVKLPASTSALARAFALPRAWSAGHLLVLQVGGMLYGITPFAENGEPRARLLWKRDIAERNRIDGHQVVSRIPGFRTQDFRYLDAFDRPIATVGPVLAGYTCYRSRGRLVCLETATGQVLWERFELPRQAECTGDEQNVYLAERNGRIQVIRAVDGKQVRVFERGTLQRLAGTQSSPIILNGRGSSILTTSAIPANGTAFTLTGINLLSGETTWSKNFRETDVAFRIDADSFGVIESGKTVRIFESRTGRLAFDCQLPRAIAVKSAWCVPDSAALYLALVEDESPDGLGREDWHTLRAPMMTGRIIALDRFNGKLLWNRPVERIRFSLDQPRGLPFLTLAFRRREPGQQAAAAVYHLIEKHSGETIHESAGKAADDFYIIEPNAPQNWVEIKTVRRTIRLDYPPAE